MSDLQKSPKTTISAGILAILLEIDRYYLEFMPGKAYWLLVQDPTSDLRTGPGTSIRTGEPFRTPLRRGWNLVGNPFAFSIPIASIGTSSGADSELLAYDRTWSADSLLQPFAGYAVYSADPDTLYIHLDLTGISQTEPDPAVESEKAVAWSIRIDASQGKARDSYTYAAVSSKAEAGYDEMDRPEPPVVGAYVSVYFPHPEWKQGVRRFAADVRPMSENEERWIFGVETPQPGRVQLQFQGLEDIPADRRIWLIDEVAGIRQDLRVHRGYEVTSGRNGQTRELSLLVTSRAQDEMEVPAQYALMQNFPNPFASATTIRYAPPEPAVVRLEIYNVLGRRVSTLSNASVPEEYHSFVWDGRSDSGARLGSGMYLLRMSASGHERTRPIVEVR